MHTKSTPVIQAPGYLVGDDGSPVAVLVDIATWRSIIEQLENVQDSQVLHAATEDLRVLARGERPAGWKSWTEFEAELDALEETNALPD